MLTRFRLWLARLIAPNGYYVHTFDWDGCTLTVDGWAPGESGATATIICPEGEDA